MPCSPISVTLPEGPSGPSIPGFGIPFALKTPDLSEFIDGFPEDLLGLLEKLQLLIPPGAFKPQLSLNFGKDAFDAILKLLDQFMPFLMLYKFFLPILNLIICIIEVLCAIPSPIKITRAMIRLFRNCLPPFLNLFPFLALIIMIISLILLLIALIEYIIAQIIKLILLIVKNILMLKEAFSQGDEKGVFLIIQKIGAVLCIFQNIFVLLTIFTTIVQVIKDMIAVAYSIPPCDDQDGSEDGCCTPEVCPAFIKNGNYNKTTGTLKYLNKVFAETTISIPGLPAALSTFTKDIRQESWQIFDITQSNVEKFINIVDGYDVPAEQPSNIKPSFFPAGITYNQGTQAKSAPYTLDLRLFYNPANWGRYLPQDGKPRFIRFNDCVVIKEPKTSYLDYKNEESTIYSGVFTIEGGIGYEDDGYTLLPSYSLNDGITIIPGKNANLNTFLHREDYKDPDPILDPNDGYTFYNVDYTFKPNTNVLLNNNLITAGCIPIFSLNKGYVASIFGNRVALGTAELAALINGDTFPDTAKTQEELTNSIAEFSNNVTLEGANKLQTDMLASLDKLKNNSLDTLKSLIGLGFDPSKSNFEVDTKVQFTSRPIKVSVNIKEINGILLTTNLPPEVTNDLASKIKGNLNFGTLSNFTYDGYQSFVAELTSTIPGGGTLTVSFDNQTLSQDNIPADINLPPARVLQQIDYKFIFTPTGPVATVQPDGLTDSTIVVPTAEGDLSDGSQPRRDVSDLSIRGNGSKDGS